jgi:hypothetical protein
MFNVCRVCFNGEASMDSGLAFSRLSCRAKLHIHGRDPRGDAMPFPHSNVYPVQSLCTYSSSSDLNQVLTSVNDVGASYLRV